MKILSVTDVYPTNCSCHIVPWWQKQIKLLKDDPEFASSGLVKLSDHILNNVETSVDAFHKKVRGRQWVHI